MTIRIGPTPAIFSGSGSQESDVATGIDHGACGPRKQSLEIPSLITHHPNEFDERLPVRPSDMLELKRIAVREATGRFRAANPRVFGSVLHGTDEDGSDIDLLVDALPGATLFDLGGLQDELESLLGVHVDLLTPADLPSKIRAKVLADALAV